MVFQGFNLLMQRTVVKNVRIPMEIAGESKEAAHKLGHGAFGDRGPFR